MMRRVEIVRALLVVLAGAGGCVREVASHCWNNAKDDSCEAGLVCSPCAGENDGCVDPATAAECPALGDIGTSAADGGATSTTEAPGMTSMADGGTTMPADDSAGSSTGGPYCGDGIKNGDEKCDGDDLDGFDCTDVGSPMGTIACSENCTFDFSGCMGIATCGNGMIEGQEQCDGMDLGGATCATATDAAYDRGELTCDANCFFNTTNCCNSEGTSCSSGAECCSGKCGLLPPVAGLCEA